MQLLRFAQSLRPMSSQIDIWDMPSETCPDFDAAIGLTTSESQPPAFEAAGTLTQSFLPIVQDLASNATGNGDLCSQSLGSVSDQPAAQSTTSTTLAAAVARGSKRKPSKELKSNASEPLRSRFGLVNVQCFIAALNHFLL